MHENENGKLKNFLIHIVVLLIFILLALSMGAPNGELQRTDSVKPLLIEPVPSGTAQDNRP